MLSVRKKILIIKKLSFAVENLYFINCRKIKIEMQFLKTIFKKKVK